MKETIDAQLKGLKEISEIAKERDDVIYRLGADRARGLSGTKERVAKDNLSSLLNDKIKQWHIDSVHQIIDKVVEMVEKKESETDRCYDCNHEALRYFKDDLKQQLLAIKE